MPLPHVLRSIIDQQWWVEADLRKLFRTSYSRSAFARALPARKLTLARKPWRAKRRRTLKRTPKYHAILKLPLVRIQLRMEWQALWSEVPRSGRRRREYLSSAEWDRKIEHAAQKRAQWICGVHLPAQQDEVFDLAVVLKRQLQDLLEPTADQDSPPALPDPQSKMSGRADPCLIHPLLRLPPIRQMIIRERNRRVRLARRESRGSRADQEDGRQRYKILAAALVFHAEPLIGGSIAHRTRFIRESLTVTEKAAQALHQRAADLLHGAWVRVARSGHGPCEMAAVAVLHAAYQWAMSRQQEQRYIDPIGSSHPAKRARDCFAILGFLSDVRRRYEECEGEEFVSLNDIARAVKGVSGGEHYIRIESLIEGLVSMGFVIKCGAGGKAGWRILIAPFSNEQRIWKAVYAHESVFRIT